jgi:hypothetical protein
VQGLKGRLNVSWQGETLLRQDPGGLGQGAVTDRSEGGPPDCRWYGVPTVFRFLPLAAPLIQGERQVLAHQGTVLPGYPPGDSTVHDSDNLFTVAPAPAAHRLQNDTAEGCQPEDCCLARVPVNQVQFQSKLAEEGVLATKGDYAEHRQRLADDLSPDVVWHRVVGK